jgi:hypothetical protein
MKRSFAWPLVIGVVILVCGCSRKESTEAPGANAGQIQEAKPEEPEIKAATPEDPGPIATVVQPLAFLKGQAKPLPPKPQAELSREPLPVDHPVYLRSEEPNHFLHTVFPVNKYAQFAFVVPPHQGHPTLRGDFRSFTKRNDPDSTSDKTADVDLMLLNEQEFNELRHGQLGSATYELDPAHNQRVAWGVPASFDQPQQYHLVFSNSDPGTGIKFVRADFTVSFK